MQIGLVFDELDGNWDASDPGDMRKEIKKLARLVTSTYGAIRRATGHDVVEDILHG